MLREGRGPRQVVDTSRRRYLLQGSACSFALKRNLNLKILGGSMTSLEIKKTACNETVYFNDTVTIRSYVRLFSNETLSYQILYFTFIISNFCNRVNVIINKMVQFCSAIICDPYNFN